ncbi:MAG: LapA family protein [Gallionella sp.]|nr:LapA family protein [Gallionella sp.]
MMNIKLALILALASLAVILTAQNIATIEIEFLFWRASMPVALLIFFTLMFGFVFGWFLHSYLIYRKAKRELVYLR